MTGTSIARIAVASLALVAAGGAALFFGITHLPREPPVETKAVTDEPAIMPSSLGTSDEFIPVFDVARIEPSGDAVIAGRAAPGATVELLRNGDPHDRVVTDQFGQFVMVPPRLPPGNYELTLRATRRDGKQVTSHHSVTVVLQPSLENRPPH
jgi:hypothetical protein